MKNVKILDCTLRDGGRIIDCAFPDEHIAGIASNLCDANIDIVELGFLRGNKEYKQNSTFFAELDQLKRFIPEKRKNTMYVAKSMACGILAGSSLMTALPLTDSV